MSFGISSEGRPGSRERHWTREEITVADPLIVRRAIAGTAIGNFMEWYDFGVYGFLATTIAAVFFPSGGAAGLIATFATLAAAFVVRPLGGLFFGPLGDRIGRKPVLAITIVTMALGTTITGLLPGFSTLGVWAAVLLLVTRMVQGFSTGGEYAGAMVYIGEHAPDRTRGSMSGWLPFGTLSGYVVGAGLVTVLSTALSNQAMMEWGWRIPFLVGAPLAVVGLYMRLRLEETPAYSRMSEQDRTGGAGGGKRQFRTTIVEQWRPLLVCVGLVLTFNVTNYMLTGYIPTYLSRVAHLDQTPALLIVVIVLAVLLVLVAFVAWLSDRIGRRPIMWTGCGLLLVGSVPAFLLIRSGSYPVMFTGVMLIGAMLLCFNSTEPSTLPTLFPTNIRYGALAIGFNVSVSLFGGSTPLIAESLVAGTGNTLIPAYYLMIAGAVGVVSVAFTPEPAGKRLPGSAPAVGSEEEARELSTRPR